MSDMLTVATVIGWVSFVAGLAIIAFGIRDPWRFAVYPQWFVTLPAALVVGATVLLYVGRL